MRINRNNSAALILLFVALSAGCKKKEEVPAPPQATPPQATPAPQAAPVQKQLSSVTGTGGAADFSKKTDPFKSQAPVVTPPTANGGQAGAPPVGQPSGDLLPIQSFEVAKFKLAGIIAGLRENRALLIDPNGKGYVVQVGMQIGNANGRITKITSSTVVVVERFRETGGRTKSRTVVLTLAKKR